MNSSWQMGARSSSEVFSMPTAFFGVRNRGANSAFLLNSTWRYLSMETIFAFVGMEYLPSVEESLVAIEVPEASATSTVFISDTSDDRNSSREVIFMLLAAPKAVFYRAPGRKLPV